MDRLDRIRTGGSGSGNHDDRSGNITTESHCRRILGHRPRSSLLRRRLRTRPRKIGTRIYAEMGTIRIFAFVILCGVLSISAQTPNKQLVIAASTVLDGKGGVLHNTRIVVEGSKIVRIDPNAAPVNYDLRGLTVLPGWIDSHVHITWSFGPDGKNASGTNGNTPFA